MNMFKIYMIKVLAVVMVITMFNGCTGDFDEINTDPQSLTRPFLEENPSALGQVFTHAQYFSVNGLNWRFQISQNLFSDLWCQYYATTAVNFDSDRLTQVGRWAELAWESFYEQTAPQVKLVEDLSEEFGLVGLNAVAKIWRVHAYHRITDYWGPVPYSQFGNNELEVPYDNQEDMYADFFTTLDEAVAVLSANPDLEILPVPGEDRIYGADGAKWIKFANSLRLRLAMRVRFANSSLAQDEAEKAIAAGVIENNADNAFVETSLQDMNPLNTITNWGEFRMSAAMESVLKGYEDPRIGIYFSPAAEGDSDNDGDPYEGLLNGQTRVGLGTGQNDINSDVGQQFLPLPTGSNPPIVVLRASEVYLLRAEGALLGWNMGGDEQDLYEEGIRQSMLEYGITDEGAIAAYVASAATPVPYAPGTQPLTDIPVAYESGGSIERRLEQIITQKWLALYPNGWEAWAELRRTGYPRQYTRVASDNPDVGPDEVPSRMVYVAREFTTNEGAVNDAIGRITGGDRNNSKVWWDQR